MTQCIDVSNDENNIIFVSYSTHGRIRKPYYGENYRLTVFRSAGKKIAN
jgi:hypothetical protein